MDYCGMEINTITATNLNNNNFIVYNYIINNG